MTDLPFLASAAFVTLAVAAGSATAADVEVHLRDLNFSPSSISARPGDTIIFHNDDKVLHSVLLQDNQALLGEHFIEPHSTYQIVIPAITPPAFYELVCTIHMNMKGTLQIIAPY